MPIVILLFLFSSLALAGAYISEYVFGLNPCILCLYQRIPYLIVILLCLIIFFMRGRKAALMLILCGIVYISGSFIALYHVSIEKGVIKMTESCVDDVDADSIEDLRAMLKGKPNVPCDNPQFVFLGISMAGYNFLFSSFIGWAILIFGIRMLKFAHIYHKTVKELEEIDNDK